MEAQIAALSRPSCAKVSPFSSTCTVSRPTQSFEQGVFYYILISIANLVRHVARASRRDVLLTTSPDQWHILLAVRLVLDSRAVS